MPRFVVLEHDHPVLHWDLMLEADSSLVTWRLLAPPTGGETLPAVRIGDHRLVYLDYEGPISGNRGQVRRWDAGDCHWVQRREQLIVVRLIGARVTGTLRLEWQNGDEWSARVDLEPACGAAD
jgi:hypothetical protein